MPCNLIQNKFINNAGLDLGGQFEAFKKLALVSFGKLLTSTDYTEHE